ncbi:Uncharacterised protein [Acinetobacter baumannii]|nr:Uncharacterised protein [Acinetobacter baumannii]
MAKIVLSFDPKTSSYEIKELYNKRPKNNLRAVFAVKGDKRTLVVIDDSSSYSFNYIDVVKHEPIYSWDIDSIEIEFEVDLEIPEHQIDIVFSPGTKFTRGDMGLPDGKYLAKAIDTRTMLTSYGILDLHKKVSSFQGMFFFDIQHYNILSAKSLTLE